MQKEKIARINALAKKSRTPQGLTEAEKAEQKQLRMEYVEEFRNNLQGQLDNITILRPDGSKEKLTPKS